MPFKGTPMQMCKLERDARATHPSRYNYKKSRTRHSKHSDGVSLLDSSKLVY